MRRVAVAPGTPSERSRIGDSWGRSREAAPAARPHEYLVSQHVVTCFECDPPMEFDAVLIFAHWRDVHHLDFEIREVTPEMERLVSLDVPLEAHALEATIDRIEAGFVHRLPWWYQRIGRWKIKRLRREVDALRDEQIASLLKHEGISHDKT